MYATMKKGKKECGKRWESQVELLNQRMKVREVLRQAESVISKMTVEGEREKNQQKGNTKKAITEAEERERRKKRTKQIREQRNKGQGTNSFLFVSCVFF
jgi:hypothetical protein